MSTSSSIHTCTTLGIVVHTTNEYYKEKAGINMIPATRTKVYLYTDCISKRGKNQKKKNSINLPTVRLMSR